MAKRIDIGRGFAAIMNHPEPGPIVFRMAGDAIVWDTQAAMHRATEYDTAHHQRLMQRTTISSGNAAVN